MWWGKSGEKRGWENAATIEQRERLLVPVIALYGVRGITSPNPAVPTL